LTADAAGDGGAAAFVAEVRARFEKLDLEGVDLKCAERLSEPGNSTEVLATIYLYQGMVYALSDQADRAVESFKRLIALDPDRELPADAGPDIGALYTKAAEFWREAAKFHLSHSPPTAWPDGSLVALNFAVEGDALRLADSVVIFVRPLGTDKWSKLTTLGTRGTLTVDLATLSPLAPPEGIEYYILVLDPFGGIVLSAGAAEDPFVLRNKGGTKGPKKPGKPKTPKKFPWAVFGISVGAGVAVAAVAVVVVASVVGRKTTGPIDVVFRVAGN
jgi:hypothetical protein